MSGARRAVVFTVAGVAWWLVSCRDIPSPEGGVLSISGVLLPSPGLVAGDTMRDSLGLVAPLRVIAYTLEGEEVEPQPVPQFVVLDTGARLAGALLLGETAGTTVRVVGSVASIQTLPAQVRVTLTPDTLVAADSIRHVKTYSLISGDTVVQSAELATRVLQRGVTPPSGVDAVIVRYTIVQAPAPRDATAGPTVVLVPGNSAASRDTTENGRAARAARLRIAALATTATDSAVIDATASYRGSTIGTVQFIIVFVNQ